MKGKIIKKNTVFLLFILALSIVGCNRKTQVSVEKVTDIPSQETPSAESAEVESKISLLKIQPEDEVILMVRADYEPYMWIDDKGDFTGWTVDVERAIWEEMGQKYRMVSYTDAGKATQDVKSGVAHALVGTPYTPDYIKIFNLAEPWIFMELMIFVDKDNSEIGGTSVEECIESLLGKRVGVQARGIEYNLLREYKDIELIEYETGTVAIRKMAEGVVDAKLELIQPAIYQAKNENLEIKSVGVPIFSMEVSLGFYKGLDPEIVDRYNAALKSIQENGTYDRIYKKWFGE